MTLSNDDAEDPPPCRAGRRVETYSYHRIDVVPAREAFFFLAALVGFTYRSTSPFLCLPCARPSPPACVYTHGTLLLRMQYGLGRRNATIAADAPSCHETHSPRLPSLLLLLLYGMPLTAKYPATLVTNVRCASLNVFLSNVTVRRLKISRFPRSVDTAEITCKKRDILILRDTW